MHWRCDDHEVGALQLLDQFFGPGHGAFGKQFRERPLRCAKSRCVIFIKIDEGAAYRSSDDRCRGLAIQQMADDCLRQPVALRRLPAGAANQMQYFHDRLSIAVV